MAGFVHGGVIAELCRQATGSRPFAFIRNDNTNVTRIVVHPEGTLLLRSFNDTTHLADQALRADRRAPPCADRRAAPRPPAGCRR